MAWAQGVTEERHVKTFPGQSDGTTNPYRILSGGTDVNEFVEATSATVTPVGISRDNSENTADANTVYDDNAPMEIAYAGMAYVELGGTVVKFDRIMSNGSGQAIRHVNTDGAWCIGVIMQAGISGDIVPVMIDRFFVGDFTLT
jgi:hypothetical protein